MKIAIFTDTLPSDFICGVSVYSLNLIKGLLEEGHQLLIIAPKMNYTIPRELKNIKLITIPSVPTPYPDYKLSIPYTTKIVMEMKKFKPDIIHLHNPSFLGFDGLIASKILNIPSVITFHTLFTDKEYLQHLTRNRWGLKTLEKISWNYHRWFYNATDGIFVATPKIRQQLIQHHFKADKVKVLPLFSDIPTIQQLTPQQKAALKKKYKLKENVAVYLGRVSFEKGLDTLVAVWQKVVKERADASLLIIGGGPYLKELKRMVKQFSLQNSIVFTGQLEQEELFTNGILSLGDIFVSASQTETFGLAALEACAHGLPLVLLNTQGLCEFVDDAGIVCKVGDTEAFKDAILTLFDNLKLREKMSHNALKLAARFNRDSHIATITRLYIETIAEHKPMLRRKKDFSNHIPL